MIVLELILWTYLLAIVVTGSVQLINRAFKSKHYRKQEPFIGMVGAFVFLTFVGGVITFLLHLIR